MHTYSATHTCCAWILQHCEDFNLESSIIDILVEEWEFQYVLCDDRIHATLVLACLHALCHTRAYLLPRLVRILELFPRTVFSEFQRESIFHPLSYLIPCMQQFLTCPCAVSNMLALFCVPCTWLPSSIRYLPRLASHDYMCSAYGSMPNFRLVSFGRPCHFWLLKRPRISLHKWHLHCLRSVTLVH